MSRKAPRLIVAGEVFPHQVLPEPCVFGLEASARAGKLCFCWEERGRFYALQSAFAYRIDALDYFVFSLFLVGLRFSPIHRISQRGQDLGHSGAILAM